MRSIARFGCLMIFAALAQGCYASVTSVAYDKFVADYPCDTAQISAELPNGRVEVVGCEHDQQYSCTAGYDYEHTRNPTTCSYRTRSAFQATDGSIHDAWGDESAAAAKEAATLSAMHDLPCARAAIVAIDDLTLEGCGQRITYRNLSQAFATPPGHFRITTGVRYMLVGRVPISGGSPTSSGAGCSKDTDCKGDRICVQGQCGPPTSTQSH